MKIKPRNGPVVYVASAFSGDIEANIKKAKEYGRFVVSQGASPINPILNLTDVISEETERELALSIDLALLDRADEIWMFGPLTEGMVIELNEAAEQEILIRMFSENMEEL